MNAWSGVFFNLGSALAAAVGYRLFVDQKTDLTAAFWTVVAVLFLLVGHNILMLLEEEEA